MVLPNQMPSCFVVSNPGDMPSFALVNKRKFPLVLGFFSLNVATMILPTLSFFLFFFSLSSEEPLNIFFRGDSPAVAE